MKQKILNKKYLLVIIIFVAAFLRIWQLDSVPPGVHADEADIGYTAYSILKTGMTQYGVFNPLTFPEFNGGTYPPLYAYTLIPFVALFDLNIVIQRLPAVLYAVMSVFVFYIFIYKLFKSNTLALTGSLLLAINPWFFLFSRQGLLDSIGLFFVLSGVTVFLFLKDKYYLYILSAVLLGLSLHAHDAPKIFLPLFIPLLFLYQWKNLMKAKKQLIVFTLIFSFFYILTLKVLLFDGQISDFKRINSYNYLPISKTVNYERQLTKAPLWLSSLFHNKLTVTAKHYISSYFKVFSINWLYVDGHWNIFESIGRHGQFFLFEIPFMFVGVYIVFRRSKKIGILLLSWLMIANIPGAITVGDFYPHRSFLMIPIPLVFSSIGIVEFWKWSSQLSILIKYFIRAGVMLVIIIYTSSYFFTYFFDYPVYASESRYKERNQALNYARSIQEKYDNIFVDGGVEWAVMYAFNAKIPPEKFQSSYLNKRSKYQSTNVIKIDKFLFGVFNQNEITTPSAYFPKNSIIVTDADKFNKVNTLKIFTGADPLTKVYKIIEIK